MENEIALGDHCTITGLQAIGMGITARRDQTGDRGGTGSQGLGEITQRAVNGYHNRLCRMGRNSGSANSQGKTDPY